MGLQNAIATRPAGGETRKEKTKPFDRARRRARVKAPPLLYRFVSARFPARVLRFPVGVVRRASGRSPPAPYYIGLLPRAFGAFSRGPRGPLPGAAPRNQPREAAFERKTPLKEGAVHFIREPSGMVKRTAPKEGAVQNRPQGAVQIR